MQFKPLGYAQQLYDKMSELAERTEHDELVFTGKLTEVYDLLGISRSYYSKIRGILVGSGCIVFHQRGNYRTPSIIELIEPPSVRVAPGDDLTRQPGDAMILKGLAAEVARLKAWREALGEVNLAEVLENHEQRLSRLEGKSSAKKSQASKTGK